jgi:hypothetical protein
MTLLRDVIKELTGMFVADIRLSASVLALIAGVAYLKAFIGPAAGGALFIGCIVILAAATAWGARERRD